MLPIPGTSGWGKPLPAWGTLRAILLELQGRFAATSGHNHTGVDGGQAIPWAAMANPQAYDPGRAGVNILRVANNVADGQTVTIGADVYEFDADADPGAVVAGHIRVRVVGDVTPANATDQLIAAINASGTEDVSAVDVSPNEVLVFTSTAPGNGVPAADDTAIAVAEDMGGANNEWDSAAFKGGRKAGARQIVVQVREVTAVEDALGNAHFVLPFAPTILDVEVWTDTPEQNGGLVRIAWSGRAEVNGNRVTCVNNGAALFAQGNVIKLTVSD